MERTRARAFEILRKEFGASARFWPRPENTPVPWPDFYWRKANVAVVITGPLHDVPGPATARMRSESVVNGAYFSGAMQRMKINRLAYYLVWHRPGEFMAVIRAALVASGKYPKLST